MRRYRGGLFSEGHVQCRSGLRRTSSPSPCPLGIVAEEQWLDVDLQSFGSAIKGLGPLVGGSPSTTRSGCTRGRSGMSRPQEHHAFPIPYSFPIQDRKCKRNRRTESPWMALPVCPWASRARNEGQRAPISAQVLDHQGQRNESTGGGLRPSVGAARPSRPSRADGH